jgi:hypothetical protein
MMLAEMESDDLTTPDAKALKLFIVGVCHEVNVGSLTGHTWFMEIQIRSDGNLIVRPFSWKYLQFLLIKCS